jgi:bis(5'-nucleosidyl)-tetraphosphatase
VLLIQHRSGGHWSFPKGHAEAGESPMQTAIRELAEETGLSVVRFIEHEPFMEQYHIEKNGVPTDKTVIYFLAEIRNEEISLQDAELIQYQWVSIEQASRIVTFPQAKALCAKIMQIK